MIKSFWVLRTRPRGWVAESSGDPRTSGMTTMLISKPLNPSASLGKRSRLTAPMPAQPFGRHRWVMDLPSATGDVVVPGPQDLAVIGQIVEPAPDH